MSFYIVKFLGKSEIVGIVKKDWMVNDVEVKYPQKYATRFLEGTATSSVKWMTFKIKLLFPKRNGMKGIDGLSEVKEKDLFYTKFSDTEEGDKFSLERQFNRLHPTKKFETNMNLNNMIQTAKKVRCFFDNLDIHKTKEMF